MEGKLMNLLIVCNVRVKTVIYPVEKLDSLILLIIFPKRL